jgi:hypothetical protein
MAYKFQSGLARLGGTIAIDDSSNKLQLSGGIEFADQSLNIADLDVNGGNNLGPAVAAGDELIIHDASTDATKKVRAVDLAQYISGTTAVTGAFGATSIQSAKIGINADTDLLELADGALSVNGTIGATGVVTANAGVVVDNFTLDGTTLALSSGDMTLDAAGDIKLDADGGDVIYLDGASEFGKISNSSGDMVLSSSQSDKNIVFKGVDGTSNITALTLDMSEAGAAVFNGAVTAGTNLSANGTLSLNDGSNTISAAELNVLDSVTAGTVANSKAVVVNATKDVTSFNSLTAVAVTGSVSLSSPSGSITDLFVGDDAEVKGNLITHAASTHHGVSTFNSNMNVTGTIGATHIVAATGLAIGSALLSEAELEKLDEITNGTAAANKAVVLDGNKDITGIRNLSIVGDLEVQGTINKVTTNATELEIEDIKIMVGSGSVASTLDGGGIFFGGEAGSAVDPVNVAALKFVDDSGAGTDALDFQFSGSTVARIDAGSQFALLQDAAPIAFGADSDVTLTHVHNTGLLLNSSRALQFGDAGTFIKQSSDGVLTIESDTTVDINGAVTFDGALSGITTLGASSNATIEGIVSGAAGTFDALAGTSLALQSGGITAAGAIAGASTINASGVVTAGGLTVGSAVMSEADLEQLDDITAGTVANSKAVVVSAVKDITSFNSLTAVAVTGSVSVSSPSGSITDLFVGDDLEVKGNLISHAASTHHGVSTFNSNMNVTGTIGATHVVAATGLAIGSALLTEAELEKLDEITNGTVAASKAVVVDANKDISSFRHLTATGNITGGGFVIGNAVMSETDLEKLDDITNGTAAANKAMVLDASADITSGLRNLVGSGFTMFASGAFGATGHTTIDASALASLDGGINVNDAMTVSTAGAIVATSLSATDQIGAAGVVSAGTLQSTGSVQLGFSSSAVALGSLQHVGNSGGTSNSALVGGLAADGRNNIVSGTVAAAGYPSYLQVVPSGSEDIKLFLPGNTLGAADAGKMLTVKYVGTDGILILTGSGASNMTFDGLPALSMSSPMAAVNLLWNGSGYDIY